MRKWWVFWPLYAGLMGFVLGASFFFGMYGRNVTEGSIASQHQKEAANETPKSKKDEADEALAFYTLWLMAFTGILAFATIGLGGATVLLYASGEKQFRFAIRSAIRQSRDMQASIKAAIAANKVAENALVATDRAWISIKARIIGNLVFKKDSIRIDIRIDVTNVGKSPATHVEIRAELCPDIIAAKNRGMKATEFVRLTMFDFGVVLFPGEDESRDLLEMEMPTDSFRQNIAQGMIRAKERGEDGSEYSTAWPSIMACATYRLAGSSQPHHTVILLEIREANSATGWDGSESETGAGWLRLVQSFMSGQVT